MRHTEKKESLSVLNYQGANITFKTSEGELMVNATEMAKSFEKEPANFLRTKETQDYIEALKRSVNLQTEKIVLTKVGGKNQGTWFCELLALRFAQWLSPQFSVWVDVHIKQLLSSGKAEINKPAKQISKGRYVGENVLMFQLAEYENTIEIAPFRAYVSLKQLIAVNQHIDKMIRVLSV